MKKIGAASFGLLGGGSLLTTGATQQVVAASDPVTDYSVDTQQNDGVSDQNSDLSLGVDYLGASWDGCNETWAHTFVASGNGTTQLADGERSPRYKYSAEGFVKGHSLSINATDGTLFAPAETGDYLGGAPDPIVETNSFHIDEVAKQLLRAGVTSSLPISGVLADAVDTTNRLYEQNQKGSLPTHPGKTYKWGYAEKNSDNSLEEGDYRDNRGYPVTFVHHATFQVLADKKQPVTVTVRNDLEHLHEGEWYAADDVSCKVTISETSPSEDGTNPCYG